MTALGLGRVTRPQGCSIVWWQLVGVSQDCSCPDAGDQRLDANDVHHAGQIEASKLVLMDICPTRHMYATADKEMASAYFHFFFFIQPAPFPETLIGRSVDETLTFFMGAVMPDGIEPDAYAEYRRCFSDPATIHAACEDYRAAASIDLEHDEADIDKKISCPLLVLWGANGLVGRKYDALSVWRERASQVSGKALPGGHWIPEECPHEMLAEITAFLQHSG